MLRENRSLFSGFLFALDLVSISGVSCSFFFPLSSRPGEKVSYLIFVIILVIAWPFMTRVNQVYDSRRLGCLPGEMLNILKVTAMTFSIATLGTILIKPGYLNGALILGACVASSLSITAIRFPARLLLRFLRRKGFNQRYLVVLGQGPKAMDVVAYLQSNRHFGFQILGVMGFIGEKKSQIQGVRNLGNVTQLPSLLEHEVVDELILAPSPNISLAQVNEILLAAEEFGISIRLLPHSFSPKNSKVCMTWFGDLPTMAWFTGPPLSLSLSMKRAIDLVVCSISIGLLSPFFIVISALIKLTSRGPVFFTQIRCGLHGRTFKILKFRTMVSNAEEIKFQLLKKNEEDGPVFKIKKDPRITTVGRFLRKFSLDEMPQLINVLTGDMSLVGPRPPIPAEVARYDRWQRRRLSMRPGITCIWQVRGRNKVPFNQWMEMDLEYIDNWSLALDIKLMALTVPAVVKGTGA